ncbi:sigma-70 family RNA polymerase sigma factor [Actinoplanes regularis]|uniref:RNA polymerase sigma factor, sigma-70 family n=1 Tax=Actinoplanes regularis TaxID=52697 RepID=A0A239K3I6_9ACTN|nr:sigma-70 family RNA polymerase sigma factor [Actinoplanes regularis]GIE92397.1 hypothetical protein Are01nite_88770 [Actinoplanes regularis]SNT12685.1 RNA polymerase sigma factor, sigma-70 family [Actinoplanes regularis]
MRATRTDGAELVRAARAGSGAARGELVSEYLPMVYTIVRQALDGHPDVDDVTQDIMLRALRQLGSLRSPERFRPWLAAIALHQISTHRHRVDRDAARVVPLDDAPELPEADARFENVADLRVELSAQRRQVRRAGRWLDADDRVLLSLWWQEVAGRLSRSELARALGVTVLHAGVRVQRMRAQLELSRAIVAALEARPRCPGLAAELPGWNGTPGPRWRKRLARHVRGCTSCAHAEGERVPTERLLAALGLLPVPATLTAAVLAKGAGAGGAGLTLTSGAAAKAGLLGQLTPLAATHPVLTAVAAGTLIVGATAGVVTAADQEDPRPAAIAPTPRPTTIAAPTPARPLTPSAGGNRAGPLSPGPASLESANAAGRYVTAAGDFGMLTGVGPANTVTARRQATFQVVGGLADPRCFSFRTADGRYLRHSSWRLRVNENDGSALFGGDATFCPGAGQPAESMMLESSNYPGWFLRHRGDELWVDQFDGSAGFRADGSFLVRPALEG